MWQSNNSKNFRFSNSDCTKNPLNIIALDPETNDYQVFLPKIVQERTRPVFSRQPKLLKPYVKSHSLHKMLVFIRTMDMANLGSVHFFAEHSYVTHQLLGE